MKTTHCKTGFIAMCAALLFLTNCTKQPDFPSDKMDRFYNYLQEPSSSEFSKEGQPVLNFNGMVLKGKDYLDCCNKYGDTGGLNMKFDYNNQHIGLSHPIVSLRVAVVQEPDGNGWRNISTIIPVSFYSFRENMRECYKQGNATGENNATQITIPKQYEMMSSEVNAENSYLIDNGNKYGGLRFDFSGYMQKPGLYTFEVTTDFGVRVLKEKITLQK